eukprot:CAMPEP_0176480968 /NCGR_PEP_ID=MMETSP0200_2-20121128/2563_1 /TAXON_ID=947934 /ORGANISM="Chaetoceros sp., Strain GSL56" /LENGTH=222 /DNA_ID=CAMNT_0017877129 /DNA_START=107 /DNA_END=775 /DNA_ORIENTATION=-
MKLLSKLEVRNLFGGAIKINVPTKWRDVSLVRQVPDYQECYQDCTSDVSEKNTEIQGTGGCLIVEILTRENQVRDEDASLFFFQDLADANGGLVQVEYQAMWAVGRGEGDPSKLRMNDVIIPQLSKSITACSCVGIHSIDPLDHRNDLESGRAERVRVELCILRLDTEETDILISLSIPFANRKTDHMSVTEQEFKNENHHHSELFLDILRGFEIVDWDLFG